MHLRFHEWQHNGVHDCGYKHVIETVVVEVIETRSFRMATPNISSCKMFSAWEDGRLKGGTLHMTETRHQSLITENIEQKNTFI